MLNFYAILKILILKVLHKKQVILDLLYKEAKLTNMQIINHIFYYNNELKNN